MRYWKVRDSDDLPNNQKEFRGQIGRQISQPFPYEICLAFPDGKIADFWVMDLHRVSDEYEKAQ